jgi:hypothetical protein
VVSLCLADAPLSKDYEFRVQTSDAMIDLAATRIMPSRIAPAKSFSDIVSTTVNLPMHSAALRLH